MLANGDEPALSTNINNYNETEQSYPSNLLHVSCWIEHQRPTSDSSVSQTRIYDQQWLKDLK